MATIAAIHLLQFLQLYYIVYILLQVALGIDATSTSLVNEGYPYKGK